MQVLELPRRPRARLRQGRRAVDDPARAGHRHQEVFVGGVLGHGLAPGGVLQVDQRSRRLAVPDVVDQVANELAAGAEASHLQHAGHGDLGALLGELDPRFPGPAASADRGELVDAAQGRVVRAGDHPGADSPGRDLRALLLQARDDVLVQLVGSENDGLREPRGVEQLARLDREPGEVSGVEADAGQLAPL